MGIDTHKMNVSLQQIEHFEENTYGKGQDRWAEIPNDYICKNTGKISIHDFVEDGNFELGVEIYDEKNQKWPFRNDKLVLKNLNATLENGVYEIISSHSNKALMVGWCSKNIGTEIVQWRQHNITTQKFILKQQDC